MTSLNYIEDTSLDFLQMIFPNGEADELNFVLFSTSGISGSYTTIEEAEKAISNNELREITYIVIQPRILKFSYGNCIPYTDKDIQFLKKLRKTSKESILLIGNS